MENGKASTTVTPLSVDSSSSNNQADAQTTAQSNTKAADTGGRQDISFTAKIGCLLLCTALMCAAPLLIQASKGSSGSYSYLPSVLNFCVETTKSVVSLTLLHRDISSNPEELRSAVEVVMTEYSWTERAKYSVPAIIYLVNNNIYYVILTYMDAATFQLVMNLKIVSTGLLMYLVLGKQLKVIQWLALVLLTLAVSLTQYSNYMIDSGDHKTSPLGFIIALCYCLMSGFAGVYSEALLKKGRKSIHASNIWLYLFGSLFNLATTIVMHGSTIMESGFFAGFTPLTCLIVINSSCMGLLISIVMKYLDNIVKVYMNAVAVMVSMGISIVLFGQTFNQNFLIAVFLVAYSLRLYNLQRWC